MQYTLDITSHNGVPFRVKYVPDGGAYYDEPIVEFYDRRYRHCVDGQFTGGSYLAKTLTEAMSKHCTAGLRLHGGVHEWTIDSGSMILVYMWLSSLEAKVK